MENLKASVPFPGCNKCKLKGSCSDYGKITEPCAAFAEDLVDHPSHYSSSGGIECIDAIESALTPEEFEGFCKGNIIKYVWRENHKGGNEDLRKAVWYLQRLIQNGRDDNG